MIKDHGISGFTGRLGLVLFSVLLVGFASDAQSQSVIGSISITRPIDVVIHPVTGTAYVADDNFGPSSLFVVDGTSDTIIGTIPLASGWNALRGQAIDVAANVLYVTHHNLRTSNVSVIDLATNSRLMPDLTAGWNPHDVAINPLSNRIYVANANSSNVSVFDRTSHALLTTIATGPGRALGVAVNTLSNRVYVATEGGNAVRVISGASSTVVASITTGSSVNDVAVDESRDLVFASNRGSASVSVIDGASNVVVATIGVPSGPRGLDVNPATGRLYVSCTSGSLAIVDVATRSLVATLATGGSNSDTEVNRLTGKVYVANLSSSVVTIVQDVTPPTPLGPLVINTNDGGFGSLRQAILDANADPNSPDDIVFNIPITDPGFDGTVFTIQPVTALPPLRNKTVLDATSQTAFTGASNPWGPEVLVNGGGLTSGSGIVISGDDSAVIGLVINGFPGTGLALSRLPFDSTPSRNLLLDNYVGTDPSGTLAVPNGSGISIGGYGSPFAQARENVVQGNLISGNLGDGLTLCDAADDLLLDNRIGTDRAGVTGLGNGGHGIRLTCAGSPRNLIEGNTIAFNGGDGVLDAPDYRFGVSYTVNGHQGNTVKGNSIHSNDGLGVNLLPPPFPPTELPSTVTPNDSCDTDPGGNLLQNFPVITGAETDGATTTVDGFLDSVANRAFEVELFASSGSDASGFGEGRTPLVTVAVVTDSMCLGTFSVPVPALAPGTFVTATATDDAGNTSEFSAAFEVTAGGNEPPVAAAGGDQTLGVGADCLAQVALDGSGSFDPDGDSLSYTWTGAFGTASGVAPSLTLAPGTHQITLTVDDGNGGTDSAQVEVTAEDRTAPVLGDVPELIEAECSGPDGTPVSVTPPTAIDNCDGPVPVTSDAPASFPLGSTAVSFSTVDAAGNTATSGLLVTVADTTPPAIDDVVPTPELLWPPNHKMRPIRVTASVSDVCDATPVCRIVSVTSNEPVNSQGDGNTKPDWEITGDLTVDLRAERSGRGNGRLYTLEVECIDTASHSASAEAFVSVPHSK